MSRLLVRLAVWVEPTDALHFLYGFVSGRLDSLAMVLGFVSYEVVEYLLRRDRVVWDLRFFLAGVFLGESLRLF